MLGVAFWRSATEPAGPRARRRAGDRRGAARAQSRAQRGAGAASALAQVHELLPGLGEPVAGATRRRAAPRSGRTLAELNLRGLTGATVLAITRGAGGVVVPAADEVLRAGDVLALAGTHEAIAAAGELLRPRA